MSPWRWTELQQMIELTIIHSHSHEDSRALNEISNAGQFV